MLDVNYSDDDQCRGYHCIDQKIKGHPKFKKSRKNEQGSDDLDDRINNRYAFFTIFAFSAED